MPRRFAFTDIHGCLRTFNRLLQRIDLQPLDTLYFLGDYIDRGPDSKGVIDRILELRAAGHAVQCLKGNHEEMLLRGLNDPKAHQLWMRNGGHTTYLSYGSEGLPAAHRAFYESLQTHILLPDYLLVHAGFDFKQSDPLKEEEEMLWIRNWYADIDYDWLGDRTILHGHTPRRRSELEAQWRHLDTQRYLDLDGGCVFGPGKYGYLCAFNLDTRELIFQKNRE